MVDRKQQAKQKLLGAVPLFPDDKCEGLERESPVAIECLNFITFEHLET